MAGTSPERRSSVERIRGRVFGPLDGAERTVERESDEVESERRAFERFRDRIAAIDAVSTPTRPSTTRALTVAGPSGRVEQVRTAFRETVMSVPHYDEVYGEPLDEHFAAELSVDVAAGVQRDGQPFTEPYRAALIATIDRTVRRREIFCDALDEERDSLATGRDRLEAVFDDLESTSDGLRLRTDRLREDRAPGEQAREDRAPGEQAREEQAREGQPLTDRLDAIARHRQASFRTRTSIPEADGHDACSYLYRDGEWTYPLLTAVTRLRAALG